MVHAEVFPFKSLCVVPLCIRKVAHDGLQSGFLKPATTSLVETVKKLGRQGVRERRSRVLFEVLFVFSPPLPSFVLLPSRSVESLVRGLPRYTAHRAMDLERGKAISRVDSTIIRLREA